MDNRKNLLMEMIRERLEDIYGYLDGNVMMPIEELPHPGLTIFRKARVDASYPHFGLRVIIEDDRVLLLHRHGFGNPEARSIDFDKSLVLAERPDFVSDEATAKDHFLFITERVAQSVNAIVGGERSLQIEHRKKLDSERLKD